MEYCPTCGKYNDGPASESFKAVRELEEQNKRLLRKLEEMTVDNPKMTDTKDASTTHSEDSPKD